ncbi:MAG TPA: adenylate/guanylate cyclase domain-containing protein [Burkholderiales bacterium]|nr:adenylate/guanylate cyclase domain-containing protein [Burkholderiales bacterium]
MNSGGLEKAGMVAAYAALLALALVVAHFRLAAPLDRLISDAQVRHAREHHPRPVANEVVVVGLDEAFLDSVREPIALLHPHIAAFLGAMQAAKPSVVGFDMILPNRSYRYLTAAGGEESNFDLVLVRALLQAKQQFPIVLGKTYDPANQKFRDILVDFVAAARPPAKFAALDGELGDARASVVVCPDEDGVVRRYADPACQPGAERWTLPAKMAAFKGNAQPWSGFIDYSIGNPFTYVPLQDVLRWAQAKDEARLAATFRDRPVLVGAILPFEDRHWVPAELAAWEPGERFLPGVLIHAQALRSIMGTGLAQPAPHWTLLAGAALFTLLFWIRRGWLGVSVLGLLALGLLALGVFLVLHGVLLAAGAMIAAGVAAVAARFALEALKAAREKNFLKSSFSGYVSPQVLKEILAGRLRPGQQAGRARACVLFADIRGFTARSESMPPEALVGLLNRYFAAMSEVIHKHRGTVDKFIGDGIMAIFGAPEPLERPEKNALEAAQEMLERLAQLNRELESRQETPLRIGIGLHSGEVVVGHVGSSERHEYTAIGDVVNVASRIEGLNKVLDCKIVVSEAVAKALGYPQVLVNLGQRPIAGHSQQVVFGWNPAVIEPA